MRLLVKQYHSLYPLGLLVGVFIFVALSLLLAIRFPFHVRVKKPPAKPHMHKRIPISIHGTHHDFIQFMLPKILSSDHAVAAQRHRLAQAHLVWIRTRHIPAKTKVWLKQLAKDYKVKNPSFSRQSTWHELLSRVDAVPPSLILAQAINESAWGTSRFAHEANNYFGLRCQQKNCGMIPKARASGTHYEITRYKSAAASIKSYMHTLNTYAAYKNLRQLRAKLRVQHRPLTGVALVTGLEKYSQLRNDYVKIIRKDIVDLKLAKFDK